MRLGLLTLILCLLVPSSPAADDQQATVLLLHQTRKDVQMVQAPSRKLGRLDLPGAYRLQNRLLQLLIQDGDQQAGYKVGFTSAATRKAWNMTGPAWAPITTGMRLEPGTSLNHKRGVRLFVESEIAFTIGTDITRLPSHPDELKEMLGTVHLAFEIPDVRFDQSVGKPSGPDIVADMIGARFFMLGKGHSLDLLTDDLRVTLSVDGLERHSIPVNNVMGGPLKVAKWLIGQHLAAKKEIKAGEVLLTGSLGTPWGLSPEQAITGSYKLSAPEFDDLEMTIK